MPDREFISDGFGKYERVRLGKRVVMVAVPVPVIALLGQRLSRREAEALRLLGEGHSFGEAAALMDVKKATVQILHRRAVMKVVQLAISGELAEAVRAAHGAFPQLRQALRLVERMEALRGPERPRK
jgi:predicted DNA-binding protein (UPF0251 family)